MEAVSLSLSVKKSDEQFIHYKKGQCREDKCDQVMGHYHCRICNYITTKKDRLQPHFKKHGCPEKNYLIYVKNNFFTRFFGHCSKAQCTFKKNSSPHYHCKKCGWGYRKSDNRLVKHAESCTGASFDEYAQENIKVNEEPKTENQSPSHLEEEQNIKVNQESKTENQSPSNLEEDLELCQTTQYGPTELTPIRQNPAKKQKPSDSVQKLTGQNYFADERSIESPTKRKPSSSAVKQIFIDQDHTYSYGQSKVCVVDDCCTCSQDQLRSCIIKNRQDRKPDWEKTKLLLSFFRLDLEKAKKAFICNKHYKQWYKFHSDHIEKHSVCVNAQLVDDSEEFCIPLDFIHDERVSSDKIMTEISSSSHISETIVKNCDEVIPPRPLKQNTLLLSDRIAENICSRLSLRDLLHMVAVCKQWRKNQIIWKYVCLRKYKIRKPFCNMTWHETFMFTLHELEKAKFKYAIDTEEFTVDNLAIYLHEQLSSCDVQTGVKEILKRHGISRSPLNSELLVYCVAKMMREEMNHHNEWEKHHRTKLHVTDFRLGAEYAFLPNAVKLFDTVLTETSDEKRGTLKDESFQTKMLRRLHLHSIRTKLLGKDNFTLLHDVLTKSLSTHQSKELLTLTNKLGTSHSYNKDCRDNVLAMQELEKNRSQILYSIPSDTHFVSMDNLETVMKWVDMLHNKEKLTHFLTSQIVYNKNFIQVKDFYSKAKTHLKLNEEHFIPDDNDQRMFDVLADFVVKACEKIKKTLPPGTEDYVQKLSENSLSSQPDIEEAKIEQPKFPKASQQSYRILSEHFPCNKGTKENIKSEVLYWRIEELRSSDKLDVKQFIDMLMSDYRLFELKYIPVFEFHPPTPMLFASQERAIPATNYRNIWGITCGISSNEMLNTQLHPPDAQHGDAIKILESCLENVINKQNGLNMCAKTLMPLLSTTSSSWMLNIFAAEVFRKLGYYGNPVTIYTNAFKCSCRSDLLQRDFDAAMLNYLICFYYLGQYQQCLKLCEEFASRTDEATISCIQVLSASCMAQLNQFVAAEELMEKAIATMIHLFHDQRLHTKIGLMLSNLAVIKTANEKFDEALSLLEEALNIFKMTTTEQSIDYCFVKINQLLCKAAAGFTSTNYAMELASVRHQFQKFDLRFTTNIVTLHTILDNAENKLLLGSFENFRESKISVWRASVVLLLDHPFSWIDFAPYSKTVFIGADQQVWEHVEVLIHSMPFRYQWITIPWLGEFHKLKNWHLRILKRYEDFHLEEHVRHFLDDPTVSKIKKCLSMTDFDLTNKFFYCAFIAGITELQHAIQNYYNDQKVMQDQPMNVEIQIPPISEQRSFKNLVKFCEENSKDFPNLHLIGRYLLSEGLAVIAYLESQKYGNWELNLSFTKLMAWFNFTTRATNYGPAYVGHIRNLICLRPHEQVSSRLLWTSNHRYEPGHRRPQDPALEAEINNSVKNDFSIGTPENVKIRAASLQERSECKSNLRRELLINTNIQATKHPLDLIPMLQLRAAWRKAFTKIIKFEPMRVCASVKPITSLHNPEKILNSDLLTEKESGYKSLKNYIRVKELQKEGWSFSKPKSKEMLSIPRAPTASQKKSLLLHQQKRLNELTSLALSRGITPAPCETALPLQLLSNNGQVNFGNKSDLLKFFKTVYTNAFVNEADLLKLTNNGSDVSCVIQDSMFKFRSFSKSGNATYNDLFEEKIKKNVRPYLEKYQHSTKPTTIIEVFDRRADPTKNATEKKRGQQVPNALNFNSQVQVNLTEKICNYSSLWKDREFGRKKVINAYISYLKDENYLQNVDLPLNSCHIVIGGGGETYQAYNVNSSGETVTMNLDRFKCYHPEADTGVFYALYAYIKQYGSSNGHTIIIDCPETDCLTILLYCYKQISQLLQEHKMQLFCKMHDQMVDSAGKKAKPAAKRVTVEEQSVRAQKSYINFDKLGDSILSDKCFRALADPMKDLGVLSIITGNDKIPSFRSCTKNLALSQYKIRCEEMQMEDLFDTETSSFCDNCNCFHNYRLVVAMMYIHLYRTQIRKLGFDWDTFVTGEGVNLNLLRDVGIIHSKGKEYNYVPSEDVLKNSFKRVIYQCHEYEQIFESQPNYLNAKEYGFQVGSDGGMYPVLSSCIDLTKNVVSAREEAESDGNDIEPEN